VISDRKAGNGKVIARIVVQLSIDVRMPAISGYGAFVCSASLEFDFDMSKCGVGRNGIDEG